MGSGGLNLRKFFNPQSSVQLYKHGHEYSGVYSIFSQPIITGIFKWKPHATCYRDVMLAQETFQASEKHTTEHRSLYHKAPHRTPRSQWPRSWLLPHPHFPSQCPTEVNQPVRETLKNIKAMGNSDSSYGMLKLQVRGERERGCLPHSRWSPSGQ